MLPVPYYSQRDASGAASDQWYRMCNSSSNAMLAEFLIPKCLSESAAESDMGVDDFYLIQYVENFGDSTDHNAQTQALEALGIESEWCTDLTFEDIDASLEKGIPVVIAGYHKGSVWAPEGGHVWIIIGKVEGGYLCHDPWGYGFRYEDHNGEAVFYPKKPTLNNRWAIDGCGWGRIVTAIDGVPTGLK
jgi:hypothetical protein